MAKFKVFVVQAEEANGHLFRSLAQVLCYDEPEEMHKSKKFWQAWFSDQIPGEKLTIVAAEGGATIAEQQFVGVVRLWKTPPMLKTTGTWKGSRSLHPPGIGRVLALP